MTEDTNLEKGLESLQAWQKAMDFAVKICQELLPILPKEEKYALCDQIRRSAESIPANIAEGYGRYSFQEGVRFSYIARGSLEETRNHLYFALRMHYISEEVFAGYNKEGENLRRILNGYITYLKKTKRGANEYGGNSQFHEPPSYYEIQDDPNLFS